VTQGQGIGKKGRKGKTLGRDARGKRGRHQKIVLVDSGVQGGGSKGRGKGELRKKGVAKGRRLDPAPKKSQKTELLEEKRVRKKRVTKRSGGSALGISPFKGCGKGAAEKEKGK